MSSCLGFQTKEIWVLVFKFPSFVLTDIREAQREVSIFIIFWDTF